jgi:hypothetical protein
MDNDTKTTRRDAGTRADTLLNRPVSRRTALKHLGVAGLTAASTIGVLESLAVAPTRIAHASAPANLPDIQFAIGPYMPPAKSIDGVLMALPPVFGFILTAQLTRTPTLADQQVLADALDTIETYYPFSPKGVFTSVSYGVPYFNRLGGFGMSNVVTANIPTLLSDPTRFAIEEAVPGPTDVSPLNPGIVKQTYNVPVSIEANDVVFFFRSDYARNLADVVNWLHGSNLLAGHRVRSPRFQGIFAFTSLRVMFAQVGLPRLIAEAHHLPYASRINSKSPMWMGFFSQQVSGFSADPTVACFQGNSSKVATNCTTGDYMFDGCIQVLSHDILDLSQFYADGQTYSERVQQMFRSDPVPNPGYSDQYTNGGGPAALPNFEQPSPSGLYPDDATYDAAVNQRIGHLESIQRGTRAPDGTVVPQRADAPGFDAMDVPDGSQQPKLQFTVFLPAAAAFANARQKAGALDLASTYNVPDSHNGIERFLTATRRQNFLCPPRSHRAFPLVELM